MITRRSMLACTSSFIASGLLGTLASPVLAASQMQGLTMYGPPVGPSVTLAHVAKSGALTELAKGPVKFESYLNPDVLRANFVTGDWKLAIAPSYVAANLANKGLPVKLLNIMSWGMLFVLSFDKSIQKPEDLSGETIGMFFRNDMPDLVFGRVMNAKGLKAGKDYKLRYVGSPFEALQLLLSGRIKHCVLPEPAATAALDKGKKLGKRIFRSLDLAHEWAAVNDGVGRFPVAGAMIHQDLLDENPELVEAFQAACNESTKWVEAQPQEAAELGAETMPLSVSIVKNSLPHTHLTSNRASDIRSEIEAFYKILAEKNPAIIGGQLPDASFYL